jgi:hypothetical protein
MPASLLRRWTLGILLLLGACSQRDDIGASERELAITRDAATMPRLDGGMVRDAGVRDAGVPALDADVPGSDAGYGDAGQGNDAGSEIDAGEPDAGITTCGNGVVEANEECDPAALVFPGQPAARFLLDAGIPFPIPVPSSCCTSECRVADSGSTCRDAADGCDVAETCDGESVVCPSDGRAEDGDWCEDGNGCTQSDSCQSGVCQAGEPIVCADDSTCQYAGVCDPELGACVYQEAADGTPCDDENECTGPDACSDGECTGNAIVDANCAEVGCEVSNLWIDVADGSTREGDWYYTGHVVEVETGYYWPVQHGENFPSDHFEPGSAEECAHGIRIPAAYAHAMPYSYDNDPRRVVLADPPAGGPKTKRPTTPPKTKRPNVVRDGETHNAPTTLKQLPAYGYKVAPYKDQKKDCKETGFESNHLLQHSVFGDPKSNDSWTKDEIEKFQGGGKKVTAMNHGDSACIPLFGQAAVPTHPDDYHATNGGGPSGHFWFHEMMERMFYKYRSNGPKREGANVLPEDRGRFPGDKYPTGHRPTINEYLENMVLGLKAAGATDGQALTALNAAKKQLKAHGYDPDKMDYATTYIPRLPGAVGGHSDPYAP